MAKKTTKETTKEVLDKNEAAKKRAEALFSDVMTASKPVSKKKENIVKPSKSENIWLEEQVKSLNDEVEKLENLLAEKTLEYQKLFNDKGLTNSGKSLPDNVMEKKIRVIFEELRNNYEGLNASRTRYTEAKIKIMLEKLLRSFPFLLEGKKQLRK